MSAVTFEKELRMTALLNEKYEILTRYREITAGLAHAIADGDEKSMTESLLQRDGQIEAAVRIDLELAPLLAAYRPPEDRIPRGEADRAVARLRRLIGEIVAEDETNSRSLDEHIRKLTGSTQEAVRSTKTAMAYLKNSPAREYGEFDVKK